MRYVIFSGLGLYIDECGTKKELRKLVRALRRDVDPALEVFKLTGESIDKPHWVEVKI